VARRKNEIGIRMALGAGRRDVLALILGDAVKLLAIGLATGAAASLAAAQAARTLLFGLSPNDPVTLLMGAAGLGAVALLASYLPARRAARLEPTIALREESSSSCSTRVERHLPVETIFRAQTHVTRSARASVGLPLAVFSRKPVEADERKTVERLLQLPPVQIRLGRRRPAAECGLARLAPGVRDVSQPPQARVLEAKRHGSRPTAGASS
jgi:hypothetical protein